jgi:hypothetical protein
LQTILVVDDDDDDDSISSDVLVAATDTPLLMQAPIDGLVVNEFDAAMLVDDTMIHQPTSDTMTANTIRR